VSNNQKRKLLLAHFALFSLLSAATVLAQSSRLTGRVMDSSGLVMPGVSIKLYQDDKVVKEATTSAEGIFEIIADPGEYKLEIAAPDFTTYTQMVQATPDPRPLSVTMQLAQITQSVEVTETRNEISIDPDSSLTTTVLEREFIESLPDDEDELTGYLQQIAGSRGSAGGGVTFVIDGFNAGQVPPKDHIQQIRINNNPYSAEFSGPGFGRVEIVTKPETSDYHGTMNFMFKDDSLNARNPFAITKPAYQQRNLNATLSGPVIRNKVTLNVTARNFSTDNSETIRAILPTGQLATPVVMPSLNRALIARTQWALTKNNTMDMNVEYRNVNNNNWGVGGFNLAERASDRTAHNMGFQMRDTAILSKTLVHEMRFQYRHDSNQQTPRTDGIAINVLDSFFAGGAQNRTVNNNGIVEFGDVLMYSAGKLTLKSGFQGVYRMNHELSENNFGGTFTFSSLADYVAGRPVTFTKNAGDPELDINAFELGTFLQTDWRATKEFNLSMGVRYEAQTNISDRNNIDPRLGFAYRISKTLALRGGAGVFHQRLDIGTVDQAFRLDGAHQQQFVIRFPSFPDPYLNANGSPAPLPPASIRVVAPGLANPYTLNTSVSLEKTLPNGIGLTLSLDSIRGVHLYRSRNINAPLGGSLTRPDPSQGNVNQLESSGSSHSVNYTAGFRQMLRNKWNLNVFANYTLGDTMNDTDRPFGLPANNYDLRSEWGRAAQDLRHRFLTGVNFRLPWGVNVNTIVNATSNRAYNITTGYDDNGDTVLNDRPDGVKRNTGIGPRAFNMDLRLTKTINLKSTENPGSASTGGVNALGEPQRSSGPGGLTRQRRPTMSFVVNIQNLLNNQQLNSFSGVMSSPFFGRANSARNPRQIEVGLRFNF